MHITKGELSIFWNEIRKQGANVDESLRMVLFKINSSDNERWALFEEQDGTYVPRYDGTHSVGKPARQSPTDECRKMIQTALDTIQENRKK